MTFAGTPTARELSGMSFVTTAPAPMTTLFPIETYSLEDCYYYNSTLYNSVSNTSLNVTLPSGAFKLEYDSITTTRSSGSTPYLDIGRGTNDRLLIGQYARSGTCGLILYTGTQTNKPLPSVSELNTVNHYTFTYDGSDYTIDRNGESMTVTGVGIHFDKIIHIEGGSGGSLQYIKVKPL